MVTTVQDSLSGKNLGAVLQGGGSLLNGSGGAGDRKAPAQQRLSPDYAADPVNLV